MIVADSRVPETKNNVLPFFAEDTNWRQSLFHVPNLDKLIQVGNGHLWRPAKLAITFPLVPTSSARARYKRNCWALNQNLFNSKVKSAICLKAYFLEDHNEYIHSSHRISKCLMRAFTCQCRWSL